MMKYSLIQKNKKQDKIQKIFNIMKKLSNLRLYNIALLLSGTFIVLKLVGVVNLSWWYTLLPWMYIPLVLFLLALFAVFITTFPKSKFKHEIENRFNKILKDIEER